MPLGGLFSQNWDFAETTGGDGFVTAGPLSQAVQSVSFRACFYDGIGGSCTAATNNEGQFALDNIRADIPEPASLALVLAALGVAGASTRRRQSN